MSLKEEELRVRLCLTFHNQFLVLVTSEELFYVKTILEISKFGVTGII